tara:strand:+ start:3411 stop:3875 length:465 start_codon:yes stop_codon:yes gene_type:complete
MKMKLVLGDWSDDGHGKSREVVYEVNATVFEVQEAYKESCKLTKIEFNHNENYVGDKASFAERRDRAIGTEYENPYVSENTKEILEGYGIAMSNFTEIYQGDTTYYLSDYEGLWWAFVALSLPTIIVQQVEDNIPCINGYWDDNLNVQFGYGLF